MSIVVKPSLRFLAAICLLAALCACGGGGGGGGKASSGNSSSDAGTPAPSGLSYTSPLTATVGTAITSLSPTVTGTVSTYSVTPALPAGLYLNSTTGVISGSPSAAASQMTYTVTASNAGGSTTFALTITISASPTTVSQVVTAANGGTLSLPNGTSMVFPPGAFATDQNVTLTLSASSPAEPPSGLVIAAGPSLLVSYTPATSTPSAVQGAPVKKIQATTSTDSSLTLILDGNSIASVSDSSTSAEVVDLSGNSTFIGIPSSTSSTQVTASIPASALQNSTSMRFTQVVPLPASLQQPPAYSPVILSQGSWVAYPGSFDPTKKTLVLIHGVHSTVQEAYGSCISQIMTAGGYQQVVGYNYDWTNDVKTNGAGFAAFLNQLASAGLAQADVEAHSYGTVNALYAAANSNLPINNMVLLTGPLSGTNAATSNVANTLAYWTSYLDNALSGIPLTTGQIKNLTTSGFIGELQPGNSFLAGVVANASAAHPNTNFIQVAGNVDPLPAPVLNFANYFSLNPWAGGTPNDGIINTSSEINNNLPGSSNTFPISHTQAECNSAVIDYVGSQVNPGGSGGSGSGSGSGGSGGSGVTQTLTGMGTWSGTITAPNAAGCTPDPLISTGSSGAATVTATLNGNIAVPGTYTGTISISSATDTYVIPAQSCPNSAGGTISEPSSTSTYTLPGGSGPLTITSDGTTATIGNGAASLFESAFGGTGCTSSGFSGPIAVSPTTGAVSINNASVTIACSSGGISTSATFQFSVSGAP